MADLRSIAEQLEAEFGLGDAPDTARRIYGGIERTCTGDGPDADRAWKIVCEVRQEARLPDKKRRGVWFRKAVVCRLREAGLWGRHAAQAT